MPNKNEMVAESAATAAGKSKKPRAPPKKKTEGGKPTPKQAANSRPTKPTSKSAAHPPARSMISAAIKSLKGERRNGASLSAIKKYVAANYLCDVAKFSPFLRKALKKGVEKGLFIQTKGSYKLKAAAAEPKKRKKTPASEEKPPTKKARKEAATGQEEKKKEAKQSAKTTKKKVSDKPSSPKKQKPTKPSARTGAKQPKAPKPKKKAVSPAKKQ